MDEQATPAHRDCGSLLRRLSTRWAGLIVAAPLFVGLTACGGGTSATAATGTDSTASSGTATSASPA